jgi:flagellar biosynthetic protein FlhB
MSDDFDERTEAPTERRRVEARQHGSVARSADLTAAGLMLGAACVLALFGMSLAEGMAELLQESLGRPVTFQIDVEWAPRQLLALAVWCARHALPPLLVLAGCALAVNLVQTGFLYSPGVLIPNFSRISPVDGARRIVSVRSLLRVGLNLAKIGVVAGIAGWSIATLLPAFVALAGAEWAGSSELSRGPGVVPLLFETIRRASTRLAFQLGGGLLLLALLDYGIQKWALERDLRMTRQQLREELRTGEGIRAARQVRDRRREPAIMSTTVDS